MQYEIIYNSDVIIEDSSILATLSIFYDKVALPAMPTPDYITLEPAPDNSSILEVTQVMVTLKWEHPEKGLIISGEDVSSWEDDHKLLFEEGIIHRLEHPKFDDQSILHFLGLKNRDLFEILLKCPHVLTAGNKEMFMVRESILAHLLRTDLNLPGIFLTRNPADTRRIMMTLEARSIFNYVIPKINELHPEQILKVREKVKDNREGFVMHLQKLSKGVEARTQEGADLIEIEQYARRVVETDLLPDYVEFRRQLEAERAGFWLKVLDRTFKVLEIDAAPWTPKFWGDLLRCIVMTGLESASSRKQLLTNKSQAFFFMNKLEDYTSKKLSG